MVSSESVIALDVGEKRIGVAIANGSVAIAIPYDTIEVDGTEASQIAQLIETESVTRVIIGYPRNQSGEATAQTTYVERFADTLKELAVDIEFQDESLTSVHAEDRLKSQKQPYTKGDIDMVAASIILQDYLEQNHGRI